MSCFRRGWRKLFGPETRRCLLLGLDAAGKTTVLYHLIKKSEKTVPTIGFNVERVTIPPVEFFVWDVSGQQKLRTFWRHYYHGTNGVIFVVDTNDRDRLVQAAEELFTVCSEVELERAAILILANKVDLPHAASAEEVGRILKVEDLKGKLNRKVHVQPTQANVGKGIQEGLTWLANNMEGKKKKKKKGKGKGKEEETDKEENGPPHDGTNGDVKDDDEKKVDVVHPLPTSSSSTSSTSSPPSTNTGMPLSSSSQSVGSSASPPSPQV